MIDSGRRMPRVDFVGVALVSIGALILAMESVGRPRWSAVIVYLPILTLGVGWATFGHLRQSLTHSVLRGLVIAIGGIVSISLVGALAAYTGSSLQWWLLPVLGLGLIVIGGFRVTIGITRGASAKATTASRWDVTSNPESSNRIELLIDVREAPRMLEVAVYPIEIDPNEPMSPVNPQPADDRSEGIWFPMETSRLTV